ncbi:MAG: hypothetical protein ACRYGG_20300 [Janthinobacterium lividum]
MKFEVLTINNFKVIYFQFSSPEAENINPIFFTRELIKFVTPLIDHHPIFCLESEIVGPCIVVVERDCVAQTVYDLGIKMTCRYSIYNLNEVKTGDEEKQKLYSNLLTTITSRGLEEKIAICFVNNLFLTNEIMDLNGEELLENAKVVNLNSLRHYYQKCMMKDGQPPCLMVNSFFENASQKSLNVKHKQLNSDVESITRLKEYSRDEPLQMNQFYFICSSNDHYIEVDQKHFSSIKKKQYGNIFLFTTRQTVVFSFTDGEYKKFDIFRKKNAIDCVYYNPTDDNRVKNVLHYSFGIDKKPLVDRWYYTVRGDFANLDISIIKSVTTDKRPSYNEFRVLISKERFQEFLNYCDMIDLFNCYEQTESGNLNCSFYLKNINGLAAIFLQKIEEFNQTHQSLTSGGFPINVIYTNVIANFVSDDDIVQDVLLRLLYMKYMSSNDPYPETYEQYMRMVMLKIQYAISRETNIKMEVSKHAFEGPLPNVLSERGLVTVADRRVHNKVFQTNTMNSAIFFNTPSKTNLNNENISINYD